MSRFDIRTLNPLQHTASRRISEALAKDDVTARTDALLAAREDNGADIKKISRRQFWKMAGLGALAIVGVAAAIGGGMAAASLVAAVAGTTGIAVPLMAAGVSAALGAAAFIGLTVGDNKSLTAFARGLDQKVDGEISKLVTAYPAETAKSSKLAAFLKRTFNPAASNDVKQSAAQPQPATVSAPRANN